MKEEPQPHQKTLQLQRMVRYTATLFVQVRHREYTTVHTEQLWMS